MGSSPGKVSGPGSAPRPFARTGAALRFGEQRLWRDSRGGAGGK